MPHVHRAEPSLPSLAQQAVNYAGAVAAHAASGFKTVSKEEHHRRLAICRSNQCGFYRSDDRCAHAACGCYLTEKTRWESQDCPVGAWDRRHLLYYIWPMKGNHRVWRWNVQELLKRIGLFNGRRIVAVATEDRLDILNTNTLAEVQTEFGDVAKTITWLSLSAERHDLGEMAGWPLLWAELDKTDGIHLGGNSVFYAHAKGVRHGFSKNAAQIWAQLMYETCLDYWPLVRGKLANHTLVGTFKNYLARNSSSWHYAGTFFWVKAKEGLREWKKARQDYYGSEDWPGCAFPQQAGAVICDDLCAWNMLYDPNQMRELQAKWEAWKRSQ